jgi:hypothetical protein
MIEQRVAACGYVETQRGQRIFHLASEARTHGEHRLAGGNRELGLHADIGKFGAKAMARELVIGFVRSLVAQ